jgi:hypothetical protein
MKKSETPLSPGSKEPKKALKELSNKLNSGAGLGNSPKPELEKEPLSVDPPAPPLPFKVQGILHDWWGHGVNYYLKRKGKLPLTSDEIERAKDICDRTEQKVMEMLAPYISKVMYERAGQVSPIGQFIVYTIIVISSKPSAIIEPPKKEEPKTDAPSQ